MMKLIRCIAISAVLVITEPVSAQSVFLTEKHTEYELKFTESDRKNISTYIRLIETGMKSTTAFFGEAFSDSFTVIIHPDRKSLDSTWQKDWNMPEFKSECWMVASGIGSKLDLISPVRWIETACDHDYADQTNTQRLIAHELVHVFHGQKNVSHDFSDMEGIDWFVEGLATYASGQCDSLRMEQVRKAIYENKIPGKLDDFWKGKNRYGLSGSLVMYIDKKYGRDTLKQLLLFNKESDLLTYLKLSGEELLEGWKKFMQ